MIVLDTHALVWWLAAPSQLSRQARQAIAAAARKKAVVASTISVLEIATAVRRGTLEFSITVEQWLADARLLPELRFEPVTADIARLAGGFGDDCHGDPADRLIAATAILAECPLVTADTRLRGWPRLDSIW